MKFKRSGDGYQATRKDGQVIRLEKTECNHWAARHKDDWDGDNTAYYKTKREAVYACNYMEDML